MPKIVSRCLALCACLLLASLASNLAHAQGVKATPSHAVLAATSTEQVRFTALGAVYQLRLEVFAATGEELFDSDFRPGNLLDWNLQDQQGQRLAEGAYRCVVTAKHLSGQTSQKYAELLLQADQVTLQAPSQDAQAIQAANSLPTLSQLDFLTLLGKESLLPLTLLVHDGEQGRVLSGRGGLSFRTGDFFAGKDQEQMRLTADGKLGLGVTDPQAKLDVGGLIRTSEGIAFPDGSVQTTAYVAPGRSLSERAGMQRAAQERKVEGRLEDGSHAAPTGPQAALATAGRLPKFADGAGNLTDSGVLETAAGGGLVQTFGNTPATSGAFNHVVEIVAGTGKTPLTLVGGSGSMEFWKDAANGGFPTKAVAFGVATPGLGASNDMVFSAFTGSGWFERMRLTNGGNLGIGQPAPSAKLEVLDTSVGIGILSTTTPGGNAVQGTSGGGHGLHGTTSTGTGVFGSSGSTSNTCGECFGVRGINASVVGAGVQGESSATGGVGVKGFSDSGFGLIGSTNSGTGIYAYSTSGNAGHFLGNVLVANGILTWGNNSELTTNQGGSIELGGNNTTVGSGTSFIDFHFGGLTQDFNVRLINDANGLLTTNGNFRATGTICASNFPCSSDARLKEQVTGLNYGLRHLLQLRPVRWKWKDPTTTQLPLGLIAQEVEAVLPELILRDADPTKPLGLNYLGLLPVVIKAIQEQQTQKEAEISALKAENAALNARLTALEELMQQLKGLGMQAPQEQLRKPQQQ